MKKLVFLLIQPMASRCKCKVCEVSPQLSSWLVGCVQHPVSSQSASVFQQMQHIGSCFLKTAFRLMCVISVCVCVCMKVDARDYSHRETLSLVLCKSG